MSGVGDDEMIWRHVPPGTTFLAPGPRITRANFTPRTHLNEIGISVTRTALMSMPDFLRVVGAQAASRVAVARVGDVRAFGLDVIATPEPGNPGHAEIRPATSALDSSTAKLLAAHFQLLPPTTP